MLDELLTERFNYTEAFERCDGLLANMGKGPYIEYEDLNEHKETYGKPAEPCRPSSKSNNCCDKHNDFNIGLPPYFNDLDVVRKNMADLLLTTVFERLDLEKLMRYEMNVRLFVRFFYTCDVLPIYNCIETGQNSELAKLVRDLTDRDQITFIKLVLHSQPELVDDCLALTLDRVDDYTYDRLAILAQLQPDIRNHELYQPLACKILLDKKYHAGYKYLPEVMLHCEIAHFRVRVNEYHNLSQEMYPDGSAGKPTRTANVLSAYIRKYYSRRQVAELHADIKAHLWQRMEFCGEYSSVSKALYCLHHVLEDNDMPCEQRLAERVLMDSEQGDCMYWENLQRLERIFSLVYGHPLLMHGAHDSVKPCSV